MDGGEVTQLLQEWRGGNKEALDILTPIVYAQLRKMAATYLSTETNADTLQPTALVHEAFIRMSAQNPATMENRAHFFGIASRLMRQLLTEHARKHLAAKRGARPAVVSINEALTFSEDRAPGVVALDDALNALERVDPRKARVIELRYFGGLDMEEISAVTDLSVATIRRDLRMAEAWLYRELSAN